MTLNTEIRLAIPEGTVFVRSWQPLDYRNNVTQASAKAPIVLLHDSLGSVAQWRDFPEQLALTTGRTVYAYDRPGFGQSSPITSPACVEFIEQEAHSVLPAVLAALAIPRYVLFGHSVGGGMALTAASGNPNCLAVITASAQASVEERTRQGIRDAQAAFADTQHFGRLQKWHGERAQWVLDAWTSIWLCDAFQDWSLDHVLAAVTCPVLAFHGDQDEFGSVAFPQHITSGVSGPSQWVLLEGVGHVPHREATALVLSYTRDFLDQYRIA